MIRIKLTYGELSLAGLMGVAKRSSNVLRGVKAKHGADNNDADGWDRDVNGCCAEIAVARYLNLYWSGDLNNFDARDVGDMVDVRSRSVEWYDLDLHPDDPDDVPFVHVWTHVPYMDLYGWMFAREGKDKKWWKDPTGKNRPAYFVPRSELHDMGELLAWVGGERQRMRIHIKPGADVAAIATILREGSHGDTTRV